MRRRSQKRKLTYDDIGKCHPKQKVRGKTQRCIPKNTYNSLVKSQINSKCKSNDEHCLLDNVPNMSHKEREHLRKEYLRPHYPTKWHTDPDEWLDNFNIQDIMRQYEEACPWFRFVGVFPIDFSIQSPYIKYEKQCLYPELCTIDLHKEYAKGIRALGFIFNLDTHDKDGSHWVGLYCDIHNLYSTNNNNKNNKNNNNNSKNNNNKNNNNNNNTIWCAYFDSYGMATPSYVATFMRYLYSQDHKMKLMFNSRRFQYGNSECGMYSMYFIICMLNGIPFNQFCKDSVSDDFMLHMRELLFTK